MKYKKVKKVVPWCDKCSSEIHGNGSIVYPYYCKCPENYVWDEKALSYVLESELSK